MVCSARICLVFHEPPVGTEIRSATNKVRQRGGWGGAREDGMRHIEQSTTMARSNREVAVDCVRH